MLESLFNKEIPTQVLPCEYCEIFKNTYFEKRLRTSASKNSQQNVLNVLQVSNKVIMYVIRSWLAFTCLKLTLEIPEQFVISVQTTSGVVLVSLLLTFEQIPHIVLVFPLLTVKR